MDRFFSVSLDFLAQFVGRGGGIEHGIVQFGLAAVFWAVLLGFSRWRRHHHPEPCEKLLFWGFVAGLLRETMMMSAAFVQALDIIDRDVLHAAFPPLEHALSTIAMLLVAAGFLRYLLDARALVRRFLIGAVGAVLLCYLATFWWWGGYILIYPDSRFEQTWCDWLFRINASAWLTIPPIILFRRTRGWLRNAVVAALVLFFLYEFLKIPDMALGERHEAVFAPIRHSFYLLGILLLGYVYLREEAVRRSSAEKALKEKTRLLQTILNAIPAPIFYKDASGIYLDCNKAFAEFIGLDRERIVGRSPFEIAPRDMAAVYDRADRDLMEAGGTQTYETSVITAQRQRRDVLLHKAVFQGPQGETAGLVGTMIDISERKRAEEDIRKLAYFDALTGLPNRSLFQDRLRQNLAHAEREGHRLALLFLDLDRFKDVNDTRGHAEGDRLLQSVSVRLRSTVRESDTLARFGGDEFVLLLTSVRSDSGVARVAQKILELLNAPFLLSGQETFVSCSVGIALFPADGRDGETLLRHADMAMYAAKDRGKNTYQFFSEQMHRKAMERHDMAGQLRRALQEREFRLEYQPQVDLRSGRLIGVEALLRWDQPERGTILPGRFIPLAEETGLIRPIGEWVLKEACVQGTAWLKEGLLPGQIGVNLSAWQLKQHDFIETVSRILEETGFPPRSLEFELTESALIEASGASIATLNRIKRLGIQVALDDFGTGYSSLTYLKHFPIDRIKIDKSFVTDLANRSDDAAIVDSILAIGRSLRLRVIAEGVENRQQLEELQRRRCHEMQGNLFASPMDPRSLSEQLLRRDPSPWAAEVMPLFSAESRS